MEYPVAKRTTALHRDRTPGILLDIVWTAYDKVRAVDPKTGAVVAIAGVVKEEGWGEDRVVTWGLMLPDYRRTYTEVDGEDLIQSLRKLVGTYERAAA
ncbi:hypothetical protein [Nocardia jiangxiensis]|uniref:hypothetical protein n=1 Tax=Nocardia jiangxiensis TaxID=282685 RepID=UPI0005954937|nr:hypothetical protein [Nocardia jiangxiensis]